MSSIQIANLSSASYDGTTGRIFVVSPNSTANGFSNTMELYATPNILSIPKPGQTCALGIQAPSQVQMLGYANSIIDDNFSLSEGETVSFSNSWYSSILNSGVAIQEAQTANIENCMMGQSTNGVLTDILNLLVNIISYLGTHTHTGVTSGGDNTGTALQPVPDDSAVVSDQTYVGNNKNLAITGTYEPKCRWKL